PGCRYAASLLVGRLGSTRVTAEQPRRRELAELVPDHVLGHVNRDELVAVVDRKGVTDEVRNDRARSSPRLDHALLVLAVHGRDFRQQRFLHVRTLLDT